MAKITPTSKLIFGEDLTGKRFGKLIVTGFCERKILACGKSVKMWTCLCDCGKMTLVAHSHIKCGSTSSCGCVRLAHNWDNGRTTHGLHKHPLHKIWNGIKQRCLNQNNPHYKNYGGRGITILEPWLSSFSAFYTDMIDGYKKGLTIERVDNNYSYCKSNCIWATRVVQQNNRRGNVRIMFDGKNLTIAQWATLIGIKYDTLKGRIDLGWSPERALTTS